MNEVIAIDKQQETADGWELTVRVEDMSFHVTVDRSYWQQRTNGTEDVASLVKRSFIFLLEREPKESILHTFNLKDIETYFPEYRKYL